MDATGDTGRPQRPSGNRTQAEGATATPHQASDHPFGPDAAAILATEHWSLLASRSLIWNEAMSRATVFLSVLSASTIALALLADATGFDPRPPRWRWCCCRSCLPRHRSPRPPGGDQPGGDRALAGHEPAAARLPERSRPP